MSNAAPVRLEPWRRTAGASCGLYLHFIRLAFLKFLAYRLRYYTGVISYTIFVAGYYYLYTALYASRAPGPDGLHATADDVIHITMSITNTIMTFVSILPTITQENS